MMSADSYEINRESLRRMLEDFASDQHKVCNN